MTVLVTTNLDGDAREFSLEPQDRGDGVDFYAVDERVHEVQDFLLQHPVYGTLEKHGGRVRLHNFYVFGIGEAVQGVGMLNVVADCSKWTTSLCSSQRCDHDCCFLHTGQT